MPNFIKIDIQKAQPIEFNFALYKDSFFIEEEWPGKNTYQETFSFLIKGGEV